MQPVTYKTKVPEIYWPKLDLLAASCVLVVKRMLTDRAITSSKFYKEVPCVVAKSLSAKYQRNLKCKRVSRIVLPVCGDKGRQVKIVEGGLRVPALFGKSVIAVRFLLPVFGFIRHVECFKHRGDWFMSYCYNAACEIPICPQSVIGVDRNSVGNIATLAEPRSGKIRFVGFNADRWKSNFRARKARVMSQGRKRLASRLRRKQSRRTRYENHRASKTIVAFATKHRSAIALERLNLKGSAQSYAAKRQWAHFQLEQFIQYKAALCGIPIIFVNPSYTSQDCSKCGSRNKPDGKVYRCFNCGSKTHRDANSAFNIAQRGIGVLNGGNGEALNVTSSGRVDSALSGKDQTAHV